MTDLNFFGENARSHHIGLAVHSIKDMVPDAEIFHDPIQKVKVAFVNLHGQALELIEPADDNSPITDSLKKDRKLVHICIEVPNIADATDAARAHGFHRVSKPVPAVAFDERPIAWLFSRQYGLVELVEAPAS